MKLIYLNEVVITEDKKRIDDLLDKGFIEIVEVKEAKPKKAKKEAK